MGNYLTQTGGAAPAGDLTNAFGNALLSQLCSDGAGLVSATRTELAITRAEGMIDAELGGFYTVPFTTVPQQITTIALLLVEFFLYSSVPEFRRADGNNPAIESFKAGREMLKNIRQARPTLQSGSKETSAVMGSLVTSDDDRGW